MLGGEAGGPRPRPRLPRWWRAGRALLAVAAALSALPLARIVAVSKGGYAGPMDVAVVLGARAYADGTLSLALADRVDEAVRAYHRGLVRRIIMSGGIDPDDHVSEPKVMRDHAVRAGVPADAIELDEGGASTALSARNVARMLPAGSTLLLVSHYFHLPRAELLFRREGLHPVAQPAHMSRRLTLEPWFVLREVPGFYLAWLAG